MLKGLAKTGVRSSELQRLLTQLFRLIRRQCITDNVIAVAAVQAVVPNNQRDELPPALRRKIGDRRGDAAARYVYFP